MRARAWAAGGAAAVLTVAVLSAARHDTRVERELQSPLFAEPVRLAVDMERVLARGAAFQEVGDADRVLRIDGVAGDGDGGFGRLADVAPSRSGDTLYVLDEMEARVTAFARDGRMLFRFGGAGEGPGEFKRPTQVLVLPWSGEVAVWDHGRQRLTIHRPDGSAPRTADPAPGARRTTSRTVQRIAAWDGGYVLQVDSDPLRVEAAEQRGVLVRTDTALGGADTVAGFPVAGVRATHVETAAGSTATTWHNPPVFAPAASWDVLADGTVLLAPGGPAEAYRIAPSGAVLRARWAVVPGRVDRRDRLRRLRGEIDSGLFRAPDVPLSLLERLHRRFFAAVRPSVTGTLAGPGGAAWVRRFDTGTSWEGHARVWDRVDAQGRALPPLRLPAGLRPVRYANGLLYGIARDALYVDRVEIYRIRNQEVRP